MTQTYSLLLVDDDLEFSLGLQRTLREFGFHVELANSTEAARVRIKDSHFHLILIDFDLGPKESSVPNGGGTGLVLEFRAARVAAPILIYTALEAEWYHLASLTAGADGYIMKKTSKSLLIAQLLNHIQRFERDTGKRQNTTQRLAVGRFMLDRDHHVLACDDKAVLLTVKETRILEIFAANPSRIVAAEELLNRVWGARDVEKTPGSLQSVLKRFRQKLAEKGIQDIVESVRGKGFQTSSPTSGFSSLRLVVS